MENGVYCTIISQLNERSNELYLKAIQIINKYLEVLHAHNVADKDFCLLPVVKNTEQGIPCIRWIDSSSQKEIPYDNIANYSDFSSTKLSPWLAQLVATTEEGLQAIRNEVDFIIGVFKKVNYWQQMSTDC